MLPAALQAPSRPIQPPPNTSDLVSGPPPASASVPMPPPQFPLQPPSQPQVPLIAAPPPPNHPFPVQPPILQQPPQQIQQQQQQIPRSTSAPRFTHRRRGADPALSSEGGVRARHVSHAHTPSGGTIPPIPVSQQQQANAGSQGAQRRQGKPIFEWFKGKLGARRSSDADQHRREALAAANASGKRVVNGKTQPPPPVIVHSLGYRREPVSNLPGPEPSPSDMLSPVRTDSIDSGSAFRRTESMSVRSYSISYSPSISFERRRELNNPYPSLPIPLVRRSYPASTIDTESRPASVSVLSRSHNSSLVSLNSLVNRRPQISIPDHDSTRDSLPNSAGGFCADDDASVRPIPPSPSRSMSIISKFGSEALVHSDSLPRRVPGSSPTPHTDRRDTYSSMGGGTSNASDDLGGRSRQNSLASTKPTTVMSFDSGGPPIAHIAVAPSSVNASPVSAAQTVPSSSVQGVHSAPPSVSSPVSPTFPPPAGMQPDDVRVPRHTRYHPRNNPHPSSPPAPDASTVTLASSTFGLGTDRAPRPTSMRSPAAALHGSSPGPHHPTSPSVAFADAPGSVYDGLSTHALSFNARSKGYGRCDDDASMRAVRRRGSWESAESRWSWRPGTETAGVFAALGRGSQSHGDGIEETGAPAAATNRNSTHTRESFRTAYSTWTQGHDSDSGDLSTLASEPSLVSHRPVSVRV